MTTFQIIAAVGIAAVILFDVAAILHFHRKDTASRKQWERRKSSEAYRGMLGGGR